MREDCLEGGTEQGTCYRSSPTLLRMAASSTRACARLNHWYRPNAVRPGATPPTAARCSTEAARRGRVTGRDAGSECGTHRVRKAKVAEAHRGQAYASCTSSQFRQSRAVVSCTASILRLDAGRPRR